MSSILRSGWCLLVPGLLVPCQSVGGDLTPAGAQRSYLVVIDRETHADAALRERLGRYFKNVQRLFGFEPLVAAVEPLDPAAPGKGMPQVRELIREHRREHDIAGAMLLGKIPYMTWRQAAGITWVNIGPEDFCYADLEGQFLDQETRHGTVSSDLGWTNGQGDPLDNQLVPGKEHVPDGQYETHRSGREEGPQIWVSRLYAPTAVLYQAFFDKVNAYYSDILRKLDADQRAAVVPFSNILHTGHPDFPPVPGSATYRFLQGFTDALPGWRYVVLGENAGGTVAGLFSNLNVGTFFFAEIDGHASPYVHDLRGGSYTVEEVLSRIDPGRGGLIMGLSGCHGGNFSGLSEGKVNLTMAYPLSRGITQAAYGCSWSGGIEETEKDVLSHLKEGDYLGLAFLKTQKRLYSRDYMKKLFANEINHRPHYFLPENGSSEDRMAALMTKLLRGHNLMGNPFLKISYSNLPDASR